MKIIDGGVTAPKGFKAAGTRAGIKAGKTNKDMAMIYSECPANAAGTFTKNIVKAAPVLWDKKVVEEQKAAQAVIINTGVANACTGDGGYEDTKKMAQLTADALNLNEEQVLVASTGVIGFRLPMDVIATGVDALKDMISDSRQSAEDAATAILTTDTHKKEIALQFEIGGTIVTMGGMCKGSGMIHPNMGTMLGFITTDLDIAQPLLEKALKENVEDTFNMVSVDGDTSTNDTVLILANGLAGNKRIDTENADYEAFKRALNEMNTFLAKQIAGDGEGATRLFQVDVKGAFDTAAAKVLAKSIVTSNLTKCAIYGKDANWGRFLCAMGYSGAEFDPYKVDITIESEKGSIQLVSNGMATDFDEKLAMEILSPKAVTAVVDVKSGDGKATAWGCDLTYDYVKINADYRS
ncbi:MAG: bifunctional ornithine acetyltransferase/N-acetylglutamate synthase [Clostridium sp.]|nr:bifunctional ornithine acetyltransferase/N-acetylglutamate synthase [Clostridium sp.]MCM1399737.1 bifunctional ornithine acetyltransferase/N-acetylglutamate synthase [Clostridium sp.]MCM1460428.1 bifunctional ornithine acetyltransferase/N-acetylglutamate synthase [Bacteroides sp.]